MAKLTAAERRRIPASKFGLPEERAYPMPDKSHAEFAERMATKEERAGRITSGEEKKIDRKAAAVLGGHPATGQKNIRNSRTHPGKLACC